MYAWIWHHLPFGRAGKVIGSLLLTGVTVALLWYVVFPWAEPLLPFDDVQVTDGGEIPGGDTVDSGDTGGVGVSSPPADGHELPYNTASNNPQPSASSSR